MAYKPSKKKLQTLREEPNLFSILDNGDIATNNLAEESDKVNETHMLSYSNSPLSIRLFQRIVTMI
ncbi:hypothetical protein [Helicobacter pylori]|uniref:hypothetical protein n=1 Tax=Helicobacter pylori TaxID=210 RepID=UPI001F3E2127|nr:hypothetical protein [Helicobacter pylori]